MAKLRQEMMNSYGRVPHPGLVTRNRAEHLHGVEELAADEETTTLIEMSVNDLLQQATVGIPATDPKALAAGEMARRLNDDTWPRLYTYIAVPSALVLGGLIGWALGR